MGDRACWMIMESPSKINIGIDLGDSGRIHGKRCALNKREVGFQGDVGTT